MGIFFYFSNNQFTVHISYFQVSKESNKFFKKLEEIAQILALADKNNFLNNLHVDYVDKLLAQKVSCMKGSVLNSSFI